MILLLLMIGFIVAVDALILSRYIKSYKEDCKTLHDMFLAIDASNNAHLTDITERLTKLEERKGNYGKKNNTGNVRSSGHANTECGESLCSK